MRTHLVLVLIILLFVGCAHRSPQPHVPSLSAGAPDVQTILADLQAHNAILSSLKIWGNIRLRMPGEEATQNFRGGTIQFQAPDRFQMRVRKGPFRMQVYAEGNRFLLALPADKAFYVGQEGDRFDDILLDVAPSQLLRELFFLNTPGVNVTERTVMEAYSPTEETALLAVYASGRRGRLKRQLHVKNEGGWRITELSVFDETGSLLAHTRCEAYKTIREIPIPFTVTVDFPRDNAKMGYNATKVILRLESETPLSIETIEEARAALLTRAYKEVQGTP